MQANQSSFPGMGVGNAPTIPNSLQLLRTGNFQDFYIKINYTSSKFTNLKIFQECMSIGLRERQNVQDVGITELFQL